MSFLINLLPDIWATGFIVAYCLSWYRGEPRCFAARAWVSLLWPGVVVQRGLTSFISKTTNYIESIYEDQKVAEPESQHGDAIGFSCQSSKGNGIVVKGGGPLQPPPQPWNRRTIRSHSYLDATRDRVWSSDTFEDLADSLEYYLWNNPDRKINDVKDFPVTKALLEMGKKDPAKLQKEVRDSMYWRIWLSLLLKTQLDDFLEIAICDQVREAWISWEPRNKAKGNLPTVAQIVSESQASLAS